MSSYQLNLNGNQQNIVFNMDEIPKISDETQKLVLETNKKISAALGTTFNDIQKQHDETNTCITKTWDLGKETSNLQNITQRLTEAKKHDTRNKILSVLAVAISIGIIVGAILLGTAVTGGAVVGVIFGAIAIYLAVNAPSVCLAWNIAQKDKCQPLQQTNMDKQREGHLLGMLSYVGSFVATYLTFTRVPALEIKTSSLQNSIIQQSHSLVAYFKEDKHLHLIERWDAMIAEEEAKLEVLQSNSLRVVADEAEVTRQIEKLNLAKEELTEAANYYANLT